LALGRNVLVLNRLDTDEKITIYLTTRHTATYHAAYADALQTIDDNITQVSQNQNLATVNPDSIDQIWARRLKTQNGPNYPTTTYREILQTLQQAYRYYGGREAGLYQAVSAFTKVNPMLVPFNDYRQWTLGDQLIFNHDFSDHTQVVTAPFTNANALGAGVSVSNANCYVGGSTFSFGWAGTSTLSISNGVDTATAVVPSSGSHEFTVRLRSTTQAALYTSDGPFDCSLQYLLTMDFGRGTITVTLPSAVNSAATVATTVNTAVSTDIRYSGFSPATVVGAAVKFVSAPTPAFSPITVLPVQTNLSITDYVYDAAPVLFGIPVGYLWTNAIATFTGYTATLSYVDPTDQDLQYVLPADILLFACNVSGPSSVPIVASVTSINTTANTITIDVSAYAGIYTFVSVASSVIFCNVNAYPFVYDHIKPDAELTISIQDCARLPPAFTADTIVGPLSSQIQPTAWISSGSIGADVTGNLWTNDTGVSIPTDTTSTLYTYIYGIDRWAGRTGVARATIGTEFIVSGSATIILEVSYDGTTWGTGATFTQAQSAAPQVIPFVTAIPWNATYAIVRLRVVTPSTAGSKMAVESVTFDLVNHHGMYLGGNTTPRNQHRAKRGHMLYVWCPDVLTAAENTQLGMPQGARGHIDYISPTHAVVERTDATDGTSITGVWGATALAAGTLTNLEVIVRSPDRFSYLSPTMASRVVGEVVTPAATAPHGFTIAHPLDINSPAYTVYEGGVPVETVDVTVVDATSLQLSYAPDPIKVYTIDYTVLIQFVSAIVELPTGWHNYQWYGDYVGAFDMNTTPQSISVSTGVQFDATYQAVLAVRSDQDKATTTLTRDDGKFATIINEDQWTYIDATTISINANQFDAASLYTLSYTGRVMHHRSRSTVRTEIRQATTIPNITTATWVQYEVGQPLDNLQFCQFRYTLSDVI
jgi:hypothetical protein